MPEEKWTDSDKKWNILALAANERLSVEKLAEKCEIEPIHLRSVSNGRATMTARDLIHLAKGTGVSPFSIQY